MLNFFTFANESFLPSAGMKTVYSSALRVNSLSSVKLNESLATNQSENLLKKFILRTLGIVALLLFFGNQVNGQTYLATESFDGATFVPTGWTNFLTSGTNTWTRVTAGTFPTCATQSGAGMAKFNSYNANSGVRSLISPVMNFSTVGTKRISFWMYRDYSALYNTTADRIEVLTNTAANTTGATLIGTVNRSIGLAPTVAASGWYNYTFDVTTTSATTYLILRATSAWGNNIYVDNVGVAAPPSCVSPSGLTSSAITSTSATVSWTAASPAPTSGYEYFYSTSATAPTAGTTPSGTTAAGVVTANITGLTANTTYYYWVRSNCGGSGTSTWAGSSTFFTGYCTPSSSSVDGTGITNVTFGTGPTVNNTTGAEANNYGNYSAQIGGLAQSSSATISMTFNTDIYPYTTGIYVDWNNDLDFADAGELVWSGVSGAVSPNTLVATFTVPGSAVIGANYRMRIGGDDSGVVPAACATGLTYACFEDYTVTVVAPPSCPAPTALVGTALSLTSATIAWTAASPAPTSGYQYFYSTTATAPTAGTTPSGSTAAGVTTANLSSLTSGSTYYFWVRSVCSVSDLSSWAGAGSFYVGYCQPVTTYGCTDGDVIARVVLNTLDNNSGTGCPSGLTGYSDYTTDPLLTTTLLPSSTYNCTVYAGQYPEGYAAWIDYNDDGVFDNVTERIGYSNGQVAGSGIVGVLGSSASFPITLACTPPAGTHRLRVRAMYLTNGINVTPCTSNFYGEIEDYTITIAAAPACPSPGLVSTITPTSNSVALIWATNCSSAASYDFEYGPAGFTLGSGTLVSNQTVTLSAPNASYTLIGLQAGTSYDVYYRANCGSSTSAWSLSTNFTTLNAVSAASSTPTLCQGTAMTSITHNTQGATGIGAATGLPSGITAAWSSNVITISGTPAASGVFSYSIPLTGGLGSVNATGTITVLAAPSAPTAASPQVFCETANATIASLQVSGAVGSSFAWYSGATGGVAFSNSVALSIGTVNYFVEQIGSNGCSSLTRTSVVVTELPLLSASVSITGTTACPGGVLLFTSTPVNGGLNPTYQWYKNGVVILNETASTYSASGLLPGDVINVKMVPSGSCVTVCP